MDKTIDEVIQQKIDGDSEFLTSIASMSDDEKSSAVEAKRKEYLESEWKSLNERADKATKAEDVANNYKTRAQKAEDALKKYEKSPINSTDDQNLSTKDLYSLMENKIPQEDVEDVVEYARFKKISVGDALKSSVVRATLQEKSENRKTAAATTVRSTRATQTKPDGFKILDDARTKGEDAIPSGGTDEAEELFWARRGGKR